MSGGERITLTIPGWVLGGYWNLYQLVWQRKKFDIRDRDMEYTKGILLTPNVLGALLNVIDLIRGTAYIFETSWNRIREGPLRPVTQVEIFMTVDTTAAHQAPTTQRRLMLEQVNDIGVSRDTCSEQLLRD